MPAEPGKLRTLGELPGVRKDSSNSRTETLVDSVWLLLGHPSANDLIENCLFYFKNVS